MQTVLLVLCALLLCVGCSSDKEQPRNQLLQERPVDTTPLPDGLYIVLSSTDNAADTTHRPGREIGYNDIFADSATQQTRLWVDTEQYVLLELASAPDSVRHAQRTDILLTLTDKAATQLASFTEQRLNRQTALVIGNRVVTTYTIQSKIDDGMLLIPQCTPAACDYLYTELQDNVHTATHEKQEHDGMEHMIPPMMPRR
jgi:hypothetical protein